MSQILKGNRPLPLKNAHYILEKLSLDAKERTLFMESLLRSKVSIDQIKINPLDTRFMLDESYYKVIAEWEHYAVLDLFELNTFDPTIEGVLEHLDITVTRAEVVINNLVVSGLLELDESKKLRRVYDDVRTTEDIPSQALKDSHKETLKLGLTKIDEIEVELRDFSATTVAMDLKKLPEAKTIIREFRQKMTALLRDGEKTDVYQLAIQFFPLTKSTKQ